MAEARTTFVDPTVLLRRYSLAAKKSYSQNFLRSEKAVRTIAAEIESMEGALVVELGPGLGTLTGALIAGTRPVVVVETDPDMIRVLKAELGTNSLQIIVGDATSIDLESLDPGGGLNVAGNLPYAITGAIFRNLLAHHNAVRGACLMVQREVQERLTASPGTKAYGALSVFTQNIFDSKTVLRLRPSAFVPAPKVHSSVVRLDHREAPRTQMNENFEQIVRAAFQQRRKTLRNALRSLGTREQVEQSLLDAKIDPSRRGETLSPEEFGALARRWHLVLREA